MQYATCPQNTQKHLHSNYAIMDSGNNKRHSFNTLEYFPLGIRWHKVTITGVHGPQKVEVGVGVAHFATTCTDKTVKHWRVPNSVYNPNSPVNLLCQDRFHYKEDGTKTGHDWRPLVELLHLKVGKSIHIARDSKSHLPLARIYPIANTVNTHIHGDNNPTLRPLLISSNATTHMQSMNKQDESGDLQMFTHTHLQPLSTDTTRKIMNDPLEPYHLMRCDKIIVI